MRQENKRRVWPFVVVIVVLLAIIAALGFGYWSKLQAESHLPVEDVNTPLPPVTSTPDGSDPVPDEAKPFTCRVNGFVDPAGAPLTENHTILMSQFMDAWYTPLAEFGSPDLDALFTDAEDADAHADALRTLIAIRQAALTDLRMIKVDYTLTVTDVDEDDGFLRVEANETAVMNFAATADTDSVLYDLPHIFIFDDRGESLKLSHHEADDNPYFSFTYAEGSGYDANIQYILRSIERRQLLRGEQSTVHMASDHPYDRNAALDYLYEYCDKRNDKWYAYDAVEGQLHELRLTGIAGRRHPRGRAGRCEVVLGRAERSGPVVDQCGQILRLLP